MSVNIETVKSHLMHAYATLGLRNRTEAAAWWTHAIDNNRASNAAHSSSQPG